MEELSEGQVCVAQYPEDLSWYRARVTAVRDSQIHVFFVDYGNSEVVGREHVRLLNKDFLEFPVQVTEKICSLNRKLETVYK